MSRHLLRLASTDACGDLVVATDTLAAAATATQMVTRTEVVAATVLPLTATEVEDHTEVAMAEVLEATKCLTLEPA